MRRVLTALAVIGAVLYMSRNPSQVGQIGSGLGDTAVGLASAVGNFINGLLN